MNVIIIVIVIVVIVALFCTSSSNEGYWSLPFAGGDVITDNPDPHMIEDETGRVMDEVDMDEGSQGDYPM